MTLTRRHFMIAVSASLAAASGLPALAEGDALFQPTADDSLADAVKAALSEGRKSLRLGDGAYGPQTLRGIKANGFEVIGTGRSVMDMVMIAQSSGLRFRNVTFQGEKSERGSGQGLVYINRDASDVQFSNCRFQTVEDAGRWGPADWVERPYNSGLLARGPGVRVEDSSFRNLRNCLTFLDADNCSVERSTFTDFGNDGIEFGGNNIRVIGNTIRGSNHSDSEKQHSDGIQGFPSPDKGTYENIEIAGNTIEFVGPGDYMQGISIFDGRWRNLRVADNRVSVNMWNAIAIYGVDGVVIEGNTVKSKDRKRGSWIEVRASKDGRSSSGITVRRNRAPSFKLPPGTRIDNTP